MNGQSWIEHAPEVIWIAGIIIGVLWTALVAFGILIHRKVGKDMEALSGRVSNLESEIKVVQRNYLNRFDQLHQEIAKTKEEILDKLHDLHLLIAGQKPKTNKRR